jgi:hypothetical protein
MKISIDCYPCFVHHALLALKRATNDRLAQERRLKELMPFIASIIDPEKTPAHITTDMQRKIRAMFNSDPFAAVKTEYNQKALALFNELKNKTQASPDPLFTASKLAIAGNILDFSIYSTVDMEAAIQKALDEPYKNSDYFLFKDAVSRANRVLFLADNAGEIVFDRILVDYLQDIGKNVTVAVKGGPVQNDATMSDALEAGLDERYHVIDNGSDSIGTIFETCSDEFISVYRQADLIISKGQGNFETLHDVNQDNIFFFFQVKCHVVAEEIGHPVGSMLLKKIAA